MSQCPGEEELIQDVDDVRRQRRLLAARAKARGLKIIDKNQADVRTIPLGKRHDSGNAPDSELDRILSDVAQARSQINKS
jgi:hypothetical protein